MERQELTERGGSLGVDADELQVLLPVLVARRLAPLDPGVLQLFGVPGFGKNFSQFWKILFFGLFEVFVHDF